MPVDLSIMRRHERNSGIETLLTYLFDGQPHFLAAEMASWLASSRRFTAFITTFRDKIRKKLRTPQEAEGVLDVRFELETAYLLLQERSLSLVYEPPRCEQARCPDFAVTFTTSLTFMLEVTRLRTVQPQIVSERLAEAICSKLGQLLPQHSNVLLVGGQASSLSQDELHSMMLSIQQRAERNDVMLLRRHKFRNRADFFKHYQRLSEIVVRGERGKASSAALEWVNPQARHGLPGKVRTMLSRSQSL